MSPALHVTAAEARRFMRRALLLDQPVTDVSTALDHHGYVQIDPINVCGRMHDLILRNRVTGYREGDLMRHLHGDGTPRAAAERTAFEHHLPATGVLVAFGLEAWPHLQAAMRQRTRETGAWSGRLTAREKELAPRIFEAIGERGPLGSDAIAAPGRTRRVWGPATLAKTTMQKLFFHGRLLIAQRDGNRRLYDLPERVLPATVLAQAAAQPADNARWSALLHLRQRRLVLLKRSDLALVEDMVQPVQVADGPLLHCLRTDTPWFDPVGGARHASDAGEPHLLAPLDPLIYDRRVTQRLWEFDYTWEVYTPPAKRVRGYYALPVLAGHDLVGHVEPKADRPARRLRVVSRRVRRGHATAAAVRKLAQFLDLRA